MAAIIEVPSHLDVPRGTVGCQQPPVVLDDLEERRPDATGRRRLVVVSCAGVLLLAGILASNLLRPAPASPVPVASGAYHVVAPGETLWSIAEEMVGGAPEAELVAEIASLNGGDAAVEPGEVVALPVLQP